MIIIILATLLSILISYLYYLSKKGFDYWKKKNIPYIKPLPVVGNYGPYILLKQYFGKLSQALCRQCPSAPYFGVFYGMNPTLMVQDPKLIKLIMIKDFYHFRSRENSQYAHKESFVKSIIGSEGDIWKVVRQNITPLFSPSKIKIMFGFLKTSTYLFEKVLNEEISNDSFEIKSLFDRYAVETIGNCLFGIDTKALQKNWQNNPFLEVAHMLNDTSKKRGAKNIGRTIYPKIFYALGFKNFPAGIDYFFQNYLTELFNGNLKRRDFTELLLKMKTEKALTGPTIEIFKGNNAIVKIEIDDFLLISLCVIGFAGYESSAATLTYTLFEIAKNLEIQEKATQEVDDYLRRHDNKLKIECLTELPYVEACIDEALRMHPITSVLRREVMEPYTLPCGAVLDKGVRIHIPAYHLHHNPEFFPNPEEYQPERFLGENKQNIQPFTYLPFGEGHRMCVATRFAKMQTIPALLTILKKFRVELPADGARELEFIPTAIPTTQKGEITLKFVPREGWQRRQYVQ